MNREQDHILFLKHFSKKNSLVYLKTMTTQEVCFDEVVETKNPLFEKMELMWKESTSIQEVVDMLKKISQFAVQTSNLLMKRNVVLIMSGKLININ